jgi:hypothetical protein
MKATRYCLKYRIAGGDPSPRMDWAGGGATWALQINEKDFFPGRLPYQSSASQ